MKTNRYCHYLLYLISFAFFSCSNDDVPGIKIENPTDGQTFEAGETVQVQVRITDDGDSIMNEQLFVISSENDTLINFKASDFAFDYYISESFTIQAATHYKIEAKARGGHGNWTSKIIFVTSN